MPTLQPKKPILKASQSPSPAPTPISHLHPSDSSKHAHFPPPGQEPTARYSGLDYDRTPIVVLPNVCALPARGCPGKTYMLDERLAAQSGVSATVLFPAAPTSTMPLSSNHLHPSKLMKRHPQLASTAPPTGAAVPLFHPQPASALLSHFDPSSASDESEESDGLVSPPSGFYSNSGPTPQRVQVAFGADVPIMAASTVASMARDRRTSTSSTTTVVPSKAKLRKGRSPPKPSSRTLSSESSSEDSCLGGF